MMYGSYTDNTQSSVGLGHYLAFGSGGYPSGRLVVDHKDESQACPRDPDRSTTCATAYGTGVLSIDRIFTE